MSTDNELIFNIYLVSIAGIIDMLVYHFITGCYNECRLSFSIKNYTYSKNTGFFIYCSRIGAIE